MCLDDLRGADTNEPQRRGITIIGAQRPSAALIAPNHCAIRAEVPLNRSSCAVSAPAWYDSQQQTGQREVGYTLQHRTWTEL